jgi:hypothetical protein
VPSPAAAKVAKPRRGVGVEAISVPVGHCQRTSDGRSRACGGSAPKRQ